ncbi:hypothetical protein MCOR26_005460 [Pyricularia oryzae]|nr:hypothetical protein MCOR26_005460 [Pyricularia oryzae]
MYPQPACHDPFQALPYPKACRSRARPVGSAPGNEAGAWATTQRPAVLGKSMVFIFDTVVDITHWQTWLTVGEVETTGKAGPVGQVHPVTPGVLLMNFGIVQSKEYLSNFSDFRAYNVATFSPVGMKSRIVSAVAYLSRGY